MKEAFVVKNSWFATPRSRRKPHEPVGPSRWFRNYFMRVRREGKTYEWRVSYNSYDKAIKDANLWNKDVARGSHPKMVLKVWKKIPYTDSLENYEAAFPGAIS